MAFPPSPLSLLSNPSSPAPGFQASIAPGASGLGTRQGRIQNNRAAVTTRKLIHWLVPEGPIVQMFINPQTIRYNHKKATTSQRTKGGYVLQYWGEELVVLNISGTTGSSGIEGINVLYDIYRNEQLAFDPYALAMSARNDQNAMAANASDFIGGVFGGKAGDVAGVVGSLLGKAEVFSPSQFTSPSLASLAFTVEMYWSGEVYRGYFTDFSVTESAQELGLFNYDMNFTVTQKRGFRQNFLGWHHSATSGPSNSNPIYGTPHSFNGYVDAEASAVGLERNASGVTGIGIDQSVSSIEDSFNSIF